MNIIYLAREIYHPSLIEPVKPETPIKCLSYNYCWLHCFLLICDQLQNIALVEVLKQFAPLCQVLSCEFLSGKCNCKYPKWALDKVEKDLPGHPVRLMMELMVRAPQAPAVTNEV